MNNPCICPIQRALLNRKIGSILGWECEGLAYSIVGKIEIILHRFLVLSFWRIFDGSRAASHRFGSCR